MKVVDLFETKKVKAPIGFQEWKTDATLNPKGYTSFDRYKDQFDVHEYSVVLMDPKTKYSHLENKEPLLTTDDMSKAHGFAFDHFTKTGADVGIYQHRSNGYGGRYHKQAHDGQPREKTGRFGKRTTKD